MDRRGGIWAGTENGLARLGGDRRSFFSVRIPEPNRGGASWFKCAFEDRQIADRLIVSCHTVDTHIHNIYAKLHVRKRGSAVAKAVQERLV